MFKTVHVGEAVVPLFALITVDVLVPLLFNMIHPGAKTLAVVGGVVHSALSHQPRMTKPSSFARPAKVEELIGV
jgi:hypothetical protein